MSSTGDGTTVLRHWSNEGEGQCLHCLVALSISKVTVIKPATSRSTVKRSTDFLWNMPIVGLKKNFTVQRTFLET